MATFIAPLPSAFNHEAKDLASEFRYWRQCFNDFCEINKITDAQTLIKLFRSCVGRHIVTYLEDLPNYGQLTTVKQLLDTVENRYKKAVNVHAERLNFRSIGINPGESLLDYESRLNSFSKSCEFQNYDRDSAHLEMVLIAAPQKIKEKLLLTPDLTLDIAKNILKTMEVGTKWVSQASSIKLDNNNDVKIKQEVNFNLAKRDKQKGSNTSEAGGSRKRFACSRCGLNRHASNDKACPALGKKCNNCSLNGHFAQYCKTKASRIDAELAKSSKKATAIKNPRRIFHKVKGKLAHLVLKKDAVPKFLPARTVPIAIEKQVDAEIEKMVKQGYWTPVSQSKWATPLVPVPKKDGGVRICGDYKPTVNTQIEIAHHPLPTVELITSKLSGNTVFSKIDLKTHSHLPECYSGKCE